MKTDMQRYLGTKVVSRLTFRLLPVQYLRLVTSAIQEIYTVELSLAIVNSAGKSGHPGCIPGFVRRQLRLIHRHVRLR